MDEHSEYFDLSNIGAIPAYVEANSRPGLYYNVRWRTIIISGGPGPDVIVSGNGNDTIFGESILGRRERVYAGIFFRTIYYPDDVILSGAGDDTIHAGGGLG